MPRAKSLTNQDIARAALAVIERDSLAGLSMRAVAAELGMGAMSLYRYVEGRDALEAEVVALVFEGVDPEMPKRTAWTKRIATLLERVRLALGAHPAVIPLVVTRTGQSPGLLRWSEATLEALDEGGFKGVERAIAFRTLIGFVIGSVQYEHLGPIAKRGDALAPLDPSAYPVLADTVAHAAGASANEVFRKGLAIVLRGLRA